MLVSFVLIMLVDFAAHNDAISSQGGIFGKKRNGVPSLSSNPPNRFLCPGCLQNIKKKLEDAAIEQNFEKNDDVKVNSMKGDKGDQGIPGMPGPPGPEGTCDKEQIEGVVKPLQAKLEALLSTYTTEIARLRNEIYSIKSRFVHTIGSQENPAKSCKEIYEQEKFSPSGAYYLNITEKVGGIIRVYCFMEKMGTCPPGSTLILKIDGTKDTFKYSSPLWTNKDVYAEENGITLFDTKETKLASYWSVPFTKICINMRELDTLSERSLVIDTTSTSLYDVIADGNYQATTGGREIWKTLLSGSHLQSGCYREGFNAHGLLDDSARARIGVIAGNQSNCTSLDSFIGFGTESRACASSRRISCGNGSGMCNTKENKYTPAFGYIFVN